MCSFDAEIIKIGQSSHNIYSNNILNFQESMTILNAHTKKIWKLIVCTSYICTHTHISAFTYIQNRDKTDERIDGFMPFPTALA